MKSLTQFISECKFDRDIQMYDFDIISESLKDTKLIELAKYLKQFANKTNRWNDFSFAGVFGDYCVEWDKVTESDWETFEDVEKAKKAVRKIISDKKGSIPSIALITDTDGKTIRFMITYTDVIDFKYNQHVWDRETGSYVLKEIPQNLNRKGKYSMRQYEILDLIQDGSVTYVLDSDKLHETVDKKNARRNAKEGIVLQGDEKYYKQVASQNIERYKKIIAKHKAEKAAKDDNISKEVQEVLNKILELNQRIVKEPIKYSDCLYDISHLCNDSYSSTKNSKSATSLLYLYSEYVQNNVQNAKGDAYSWAVNEQDSIAKKVKDKLIEIKERIVNIEAKMSDK